MFNRRAIEGGEQEAVLSVDKNADSDESSLSASSKSNDKEEKLLRHFLETSFDLSAIPKSPSTLSTRKSLAKLSAINQLIDYSSEPNSANDVYVIDDTQSENDSPRELELKRHPFLFGGNIATVKRNKSAPDLLSPRVHAHLV